MMPRWTGAPHTCTGPVVRVSSNRSLYIYPQSSDWLTDWLICLHNAPTNLTKVKNHTLAKLLQVFRQQVTWTMLLRIQPENSLEEYLVDNKNNKLKIINVFTSISVRTWWESPTRWDKKDSLNISRRGLTSAVLLWFHLSSSSAIQSPF